MDTQSSKNKNIIIIIVGVTIAIFTLVIILESRQINALKKSMGNTLPVEKSHSILNKKNLQTVDTNENQLGIKVDNDSFKKIELPNDISSYKKKIKELESQIDDMQAWQDYLEDSLEKNTMNVINDVSGFPDVFLRTMIDGELSPFLKRNKLSPDIKKALKDLLLEERRAIYDLDSGKTLSEDISYEKENIHSMYNEQISQLLSPEDYAEFTKYKKFEYQWILLDKIATIYKDIELEGVQEKQLIEAMYDNRSNAQEIQRVQSFDDRIKYYRKNISSAKAILTEFQFEIIKKYFENEIYLLERNRAFTMPTNSDEETNNE